MSTIFPQKQLLQDGRELIIRAARKEDAVGTLECINQAGGETPYLTFDGGSFPATLADEQRFIEYLAHTWNALMLVADLEGSVVGILTFEGGRTKRVSHTGELGISVLKAYWGQGIGTSMVAALIAWARENGIRKINLRVRQDNQRAINIYYKFGFKVEGQITREYKIGDHFYDNLVMGLVID
jgi:RimJ/RimL family protein N-acetyltransferase